MEKHHTFMHFFANKELTEMYATQAMRSFSLAMIGIFVPLLFLENGYSYLQMFTFAATLPFFMFMSFLFASVLINKIGVKHTMMLSVPFLLLAFGGLYTLATYRWHPVLIALVLGMSSGLHWLAFHIEFSRFTSKKKRGGQIGALQSMAILCAVAGPILGGFIISVGGEQLITLMSGSVLILSIIPLLLTPDEKLHVDISWKKLLVVCTTRQRVAFFSEGIRYKTALILWPVFIYSLGVGFLVIGSVYTIVRIVMAMTTFVVGKWIDNHHPRKLLRFGASFHSLSMMARGFLVATTTSITAITSFSALTFVLMNTPFSKIWYDHAHTRGATFIFAREFFVQAGSIFAMTTAIIIFSITQNITITAITLFFIAGFAALCINFIE